MILFALKLTQIVFILLINVQMPTIVRILTFISRILCSVMLSITSPNAVLEPHDQAPRL